MYSDIPDATTITEHNSVILVTRTTTFQTRGPNVLTACDVIGKIHNTNETLNIQTFVRAELRLRFVDEDRTRHQARNNHRLRNRLTNLTTSHLIGKRLRMSTEAI